MVAAHRVRRAGGAIAAALALVVVTAGCGSGAAPTAAGTSATAPGASVVPRGAAPGPSTRVSGGLPRPAHVVVVIEENRSASDVLGNPAAPYLNGLAARGAVLTDAHGVTHPSQPNYLALFSGSTQGVRGDRCPPPGSPFAGPDLASALAAVGGSFASYAEGLPATGSTVCVAGSYARKHDPAADFADVPPGENRPFSAFPADPATLPTVSFVVPDLAHDMHDGTVAQGDAWVRDHLDPYVRWADRHGSLLVVTWDEDDGSTANHIPTLLVGPMVRAGRSSERVDHYGLLHTLTALYGAAAPGRAAAAPVVTGIWAGG